MSFILILRNISLVNNRHMFDFINFISIHTFISIKLHHLQEILNINIDLLRNCEQNKLKFIKAYQFSFFNRDFISLFLQKLLEYFLNRFMRNQMFINMILITEHLKTLSLYKFTRKPRWGSNLGVSKFLE